ncbi:MAG: HAD family phosphatase [Candidatus Nanoarchaeia archaeon]
MIKVIIFDYFGVFAKPGTFDALIEDTAQKYEVDEDKFRSLRRKLWDKARVSEISEKEFWETLVKEIRLPISSEQLKKEWYGSFSPIQETFELAERLKKNYKVALISNTILEWFTYWKKKYDLEDVFDAIFVSYELKVAKPGKEIFLIALKKLKVKAEECVFIDDKLENLETAKELGMEIIQFKDTTKVKKRLKELNVLC